MDRNQKLAVLGLYSLYFRPKRTRQKRKFWHKPWLGDYQRLTKSFVFNLEPLILQSTPEDFRCYVRLLPELYSEILAEISPMITKKDVNSRLAITPREKLSITLSYLAEGLSLKRLSYEYRIAISTANVIINDTLQALETILVPKYLKMPSLEQEWNSIAQRFQSQWQFPNCIGALDGKHCHMFPPRNSGSLYYNYKEGFSIVLMALVDADYKFIGVDIGANGKCCDSGIWTGSRLRSAILNNSVGLPAPQPLLGTSQKTPFVILADSGFPLEEFVMRPYPDKNMTPKQRVFNYRLSRARRVSENAFGILANRWRILMNRMLASPEKATLVVTVCCALHNMICSKAESKEVYIPHGFVDEEDLETGDVRLGLWRKHQLTPLPSKQYRNVSNDGKKVREVMKEYLSDSGRVPWQDKYANN